MDGYDVSLSAEEGVFPEDTKVTIRKVNTFKGKEISDLLEDELPEDEQAEATVAFDIKFFDDGTEIEPEDGSVQVAIDLQKDIEDLKDAKDLDAEDLSADVFHIEDDGGIEQVESDLTDTTATFDAESFSIYGITIKRSDAGNKYTITFDYGDHKPQAYFAFFNDEDASYSDDTNKGTIIVPAGMELSSTGNGFEYDSDDAYNCLISSPESNDMVYALTGWRTSDNKVISMNRLNSYIPAGNETLTAVWKDTWKVTLKDAAEEEVYYVAKGEQLMFCQFFMSYYNSDKYVYVDSWKNTEGKEIRTEDLAYYRPEKDDTLTASDLNVIDIYTVTLDLSNDTKEKDPQKSIFVPRGKTLQDGIHKFYLSRYYEVINTDLREMVMVWTSKNTGKEYYYQPAGEQKSVFDYQPEGNDTLYPVEWGTPARAAGITVQISYGDFAFGQGGSMETPNVYDYTLSAGEKITEEDLKSFTDEAPYLSAVEDEDEWEDAYNYYANSSFYRVSDTDDADSIKAITGWTSTKDNKTYKWSELGNYDPQEGDMLTAQWADAVKIHFDYDPDDTHNKLLAETGEDYYLAAGDALNYRPYFRNVAADGTVTEITGWKNEAGKTFNLNDILKYAPTKDETLTAVWNKEGTVKKYSDTATPSVPATSSDASHSGSSSPESSDTTIYGPNGTAQTLTSGNWEQTADGSWMFKGTNGSYCRNTWAYLSSKTGSHWYYFDANGKMVTGWILSGGSWYYLTESGTYLGAAATGLFQDPSDGNWYYLDPVTFKMRTGYVKIDGADWWFNNVPGTASGWVQDKEGRWKYQKGSSTPLGARMSAKPTA